jgi:hypothetical protein
MESLILLTQAEGDTVTARAEDDGQSTDCGGMERGEDGTLNAQFDTR